MIKAGAYDEAGTDLFRPKAIHEDFQPDRDGRRVVLFHELTPEHDGTVHGCLWACNVRIGGRIFEGSADEFNLMVARHGVNVRFVTWDRNLAGREFGGFVQVDVPRWFRR